MCVGGGGGGVRRELSIFERRSLLLTEDLVGWLVGWLVGFNGPLRQYFSLYRVVSQGGEKEEK